MSPLRKQAVPGFTLAELMVSLALLGIISTFTITKLITASQTQKRDAVLKETVASIYDAVHQGRLTGELVPGTFTTYMLSRLNYVKACASDASSEGCWDKPVQGEPGNDVNEPGVVLHNGAVVAGLNNHAGDPYDNSVIVDWNGATAPNQVGQDQLTLYICYDPDSDCSCNARRGTIVSSCQWFGATEIANSAILFDELYQ